jgi:signal transduction histidine kinase
MQIKSFIIFFIICLLPALPLLFFTTPLELFFMDTKFIIGTMRYRSYDISDHIAIVLIDAASEASLSLPIEGKGWRKYDPDIITLLNQSGALVIAFDVEFSGETTPWDQTLAQQYREAGNVIACEITERNTLPVLADALSSLGNASVKNFFGKPRKVDLFPDTSEQKAFSYEVVSAFFTFLPQNDGPGNRNNKKQNLKNAMAEGEYWINYTYPLHYFPVFSYVDLLKAKDNRIGNHDKTPLSVFKNKIVLIAKDFQKDKVPLPNNFGIPVFGGLVHAYGMETLINGSSLVRIPLAAEIIILLCLLGCSHLVLRNTRGGKSILAVSLLCLIVFIIQSVLFLVAGLWFLYAPFFTGVILSVIVYSIYRRYILRKEFQHINSQVSRLAHFNSQLEETGKLKDILTDTLVHDIKNAIAAVEGSLSFITEKYKDDSQSLEIFHAASIACTDIINLSSNLLDVRNIEEGKFEIRKESCTCDQLRAMINRFTHYPLFYEKKINVDIALPGGEAVFFADMYLLEQIFHNLLNNALKYTPLNGSIFISGKTGENSETVLSFFNSGKPIPAEMEDSIFEKYKRGKKKRSKYSKGLGLYFCKMAMELQGGRIWLETAESGNYFHLGFPPAKTPADH